MIFPALRGLIFFTMSSGSEKVHALANYQRACTFTSECNGFITLCNDIIQVSHR